MLSRRCFLLFSLLLDLSVAWGPILEPKGGSVLEGRVTTRNTDSFSSSTTSTDSMSTRTDSETTQERSHTTRYSFTQSLDYRESRRNLDGDIIPRLFISRPLLVDFDVFGVVNPFDTATVEPSSPVSSLADNNSDFDDHADDEEEDCLIPEEYKMVDPQDAAHVLAYLGIQRAKPVESTLRLVRPGARP